MQKRLWKKRFVGFLTAGTFIFFGGCDIEGLFNRARIGFAEQAGAWSFNAVLGLAGIDSSGDLGLCLGGSGCPDDD